MPAYNAEKTIASSIGSVISQTFGNWELIVVNDASTDTTAQIVNAHAENDLRIHLYANEKNMGIAKSRNFGVLRAKYQWIAFLDSDDCWHESKLQKQLDFIEKTSAKISYTGTVYINEANIKSDYVLQAKKDLTYRDLLIANLMSCSSVIVCRDLLLRYPFPEGELHEDYVVWLQILKEVEYAYGLDEPLLLYRMSSSSKSANRVRSAKMILNAYNKVGYGSVVAVLLTLRYALHSISKRSKIKLGW